MNNIWNNLDLIEAWKNNELDAKSKKEFESNLKYNPELAKELEIHNLLMNHIQTYGNARTQSTINKVVANLENEGFFKDVKNGVRPMNQISTKKSFSAYALAASILALIVVSFLIFSPKQQSLPSFAEIRVETKQLVDIENGKLEDAISRLEARGFANSNKTKNDSLAAALRFYEEFKYSESRAALLQYLFSYPNEKLAILYLGLSYLQTSEYAKAAKYLSPLTRDEGFEFKNMAKWYTSMCYAKFGGESNMNVAKGLLKELADDPSSVYTYYAKSYYDLLNN